LDRTERSLIIYVLSFIIALLLTLTVCLLWWQSSIEPPHFDTTFEVRESEPLRLSRDGQGWTVTAQAGTIPAILCTGISPEALDAPTVLVPANGSFHAGGAPLPHKRYFYEINLENGDAYRSAERLLPLEGAINFRDLGGYETSYGQSLAWGKIYRSDELCRLSKADLLFIQGLGIRLVCDLRGDYETEPRPDRLPQGSAYRHIPVFNRDPIGSLRVVFARQRLDPLIKRMYRELIIERGAPVIGAVLKLVADPSNLPLVWHCTSGKDRAGVISALLLHICGVPRHTIIADYSLTNLSIQRFIASIREQMLGKRIPPGLKLEQTYPLFSARPALIELAFDHIEKTYSSVDEYLRGAVGLAEGDILAIRNNLLV
jgi:protein-tyrosine phosphatase